MAWTVDGSHNLTGPNVTWTPAASSNYTISLIVGSSTGLISVNNSGTAQRTDAVTISPVVAANLVSTIDLLSSED